MFSKIFFVIFYSATVVFAQNCYVEGSFKSLKANIVVEATFNSLECITEYATEISIDDLDWNVLGHLTIPAESFPHIFDFNFYNAALDKTVIPGVTIERNDCTGSEYINGVDEQGIGKWGMRCICDDQPPITNSSCGVVHDGSAFDNLSGNECLDCAWNYTDPNVSVEDIVQSLSSSFEAISTEQKNAIQISITEICAGENDPECTMSNMACISLSVLRGDPILSSEDCLNLIQSDTSLLPAGETRRLSKSFHLLRTFVSGLLILAAVGAAVVAGVATPVIVVGAVATSAVLAASNIYASSFAIPLIESGVETKSTFIEVYEDSKTNGICSISEDEGFCSTSDAFVAEFIKAKDTPEAKRLIQIVTEAEACVCEGTCVSCRDTMVQAFEFVEGKGATGDCDTIKDELRRRKLSKPDSSQSSLDFAVLFALTCSLSSNFFDTTKVQNLVTPVGEPDIKENYFTGVIPNILEKLKDLGFVSQVDNGARAAVRKVVDLRDSTDMNDFLARLRVLIEEDNNKLPKPLPPNNFTIELGYSDSDLDGLEDDKSNLFFGKGFVADLTDELVLTLKGTPEYVSHTDEIVGELRQDLNEGSWNSKFVTDKDAQPLYAPSKSDRKLHNKGQHVPFCEQNNALKWDSPTPPELIGHDVDVYVIDTPWSSASGFREIFINEPIEGPVIMSRTDDGTEVPAFPVRQSDSIASSHGTEMMSLISSTPFGLARGAQVIGVVDTEGGPIGLSFMVRSLQLIYSQIKLKKKRAVISHSAGFSTRSYDGEDVIIFEDRLNRELAKLKKLGVVFLTAAPNVREDRCNSDLPTMLDDATGISLMSAKSESEFEIYYAYGDCVDLTAPGVRALASDGKGRHIYKSGTSIATAITAGSVAAYLSTVQETGPALVEKIRAKFFGKTSRQASDPIGHLYPILELRELGPNVEGN